MKNMKIQMYIPDKANQTGSTDEGTNRNATVLTQGLTFKSC